MKKCSLLCMLTVSIAAASLLTATTAVARGGAIAAGAGRAGINASAVSAGANAARVGTSAAANSASVIADNASEAIDTSAGTTAPGPKKTKTKKQLPAIASNDNWRPIITLTGGVDFVKRGQQQTLTLLPNYQNLYTVANGRRAMVDGGLFIGAERTLTDNLAAQVGIAGYMAAPSMMNGDVWQFASPAFDNLYYNYEIHHERVMVGGKLLYLPHESYRPYLSAEMGVSFNQATYYHERYRTLPVTTLAPFSANSTVSFAWATGLGIEYQLNDKARLGFGYEFVDLGRVQLGTSPSQTTNQTLVIDNFYSNQLRMQFTYLF